MTFPYLSELNAHVAECGQCRSVLTESRGCPEGLAVLMNMQRAYGVEPKEVPAGVYICGLCGDWHAGDFCGTCVPGGE